jgi:hypothetical protein
MPGYLPKPSFPVLNKAHPLSQGLVLAMPFTELAGTKVYDLSGRNHHGTLNNGPVRTNTPFGKGVDFDGDDDNGTIPDHDDLDIQLTGFTILAWIYVQALPGEGNYNPIISKTRAGGNVEWLFQTDGNNSNKMNLSLYDGTNVAFVLSNTVITLNTWYQVVCTWDLLSLRMYMNGKYENIAGKGAYTPSNSAFQVFIGEWELNHRNFNGIIDHIMIWDRALSENEIAQLYQDPFCMLRTKNLFSKMFDFDRPIFFRIVDKLKTLIRSYMTQANGFSLDYGSVDQYNPAERIYPAVFIEYPETSALEDDFQVIERDSETTDINIRVIAETTADLDKTAFWIVNDFGFLFESFKGTLKVEGLEQYDLMGSEVEFTNSSKYPVEVVMTYRLKYRRQNDDLYTPDTSDTAEAFSGSSFAGTKPIIMQIIDDIETKIAAMTIANGYNFDYGSLDQFNPASRTYPAVFLKYSEETGLDEDEGSIGFYESMTRMEIHVIAGANTDVDKHLFLTRSDFQKMFKDNQSSFSGNGMERAEYEGTEQRYNLTNAYPWEMILIYNLYHRRLKTNPYHA